MMLKDDPTNHDRPVRRVSATEQPIANPTPAPSGLFYACNIAAAALLMAAISAVALFSAGPSDATASALIAADAQAAAQAPQTELVDLVAAQLSGTRPEHISPHDWAAAQRAVQALKGQE